VDNYFVCYVIGSGIVTVTDVLYGARMFMGYYKRGILNMSDREKKE